MTRIFFALALFAVILLGVNLALGLMIGDFNGISQQLLRARKAARTQVAPEPAHADTHQNGGQHLGEITQRLRPIRRRASLHMLFGIAATLVTVLVNCITVTYFIGTSRWCREVAETYQLGSSDVDQSNLLKRRTFPWAMMGILSVLTILTLGAASDPGAGLRNSAQFVTPHFAAALLGTSLIAWSFLIQLGNVAANYEVIEKILAQVNQIRTERGMDS